MLLLERSQQILRRKSLRRIQFMSNDLRTQLLRIDLQIVPLPRTRLPQRQDQPIQHHDADKTQSENIASFADLLPRHEAMFISEDDILKMCSELMSLSEEIEAYFPAEGYAGGRFPVCEEDAEGTKAGKRFACGLWIQRLLVRKDLQKSFPLLAFEEAIVVIEKSFNEHGCCLFGRQDAVLSRGMEFRHCSHSGDMASPC